MSEEIVQGVIETIDSANQHRLRLAELINSLDEAAQQVKESSATSQANITEHFAKLRLALNEAIERRESLLLEQVQEIERESLQPLNECREMIEQEAQNANTVLKEGKTLLCSEHEGAEAAMINFKRKVNDLDLNSLPEVPSLSEVACIFVDLPDAALQQFQGEVSDYGRVLARAPVQITEVSDRPGGVLVKWAEIEEESALDLSEFKLQFAEGDVKVQENAAFTDAYVGTSTCYVVRNLPPNTLYTFRVCGRAEGAELWSPWSIPLCAATQLKHHEWRSGNSGYTLSDDNKVAQRVSGGVGPILFSNAASYTCGHTLKLKVIEEGPAVIGDGIALSQSDSKVESLQQQGTLFISSQGTVYIDGQERTTKLPRLHQGSTLTFDTEVLQSGKVRATIEVDDRIATFDWSVEASASATGAASLSANPMLFTAASEKKDDKKLFFALRFAGDDWKVAVE